MKTKNTTVQKSIRQIVDTVVNSIPLRHVYMTAFLNCLVNTP